MGKDAYYFSHDSNARHDPKILAMRSVYGVHGYGMYWIIIEMLRESDEYKLPKSKFLFNAIAMQMQCKDVSKEYANQFVSDCINEFDLLTENAHFIWSPSLLKRMEIKDDISEKRRKAAKARWNKADNDGDSEQEESKSNANAEQKSADAKQDYAKEKKRNESKINKKDINAHFDSFWSMYPKKADKQRALLIFAKLVQKYEPEKIIEGAKSYSEQCRIEGTEKKYIKNASTFLNNKCFLDDFEINVNFGSHNKQNGFTPSKTKFATEEDTKNAYADDE
jgi:hypothetical protein